MTFGMLLGVLGALCLVLGVIALAARVARGVAPRPYGQLPMRVVGRVGLGAKQGLAAVQVGERVLVVSVGDGGVRTLLELDELPAPDDDAGTRGGAGHLHGPATGADSSGLAAAWALAWGAVAGTGQGAARSRTRRLVPGRLSLARLARKLGLATVLAVALGGALVASPTMASAQGSGVTAGAASGAAAGAGAPVGAAASSQRQDALGALGQALPSMNLQVGDEDGLRLSGTVGTVLVLGLLTLLPTLILLMTSFTRVLIVLHFLRQALGTQTAPPAQMIAALALLLSGFIMAPTLSRVNETALRPWMDGQLDEAQMMGAAVVPFREFMASHVRESDLGTFLELSNAPAPETIDDVPLVTLVSAFAISELRTAFQIGFVLFLPFLVIDLVVAAVLMSLGMFMLPPVMVSLPFKLLLFVLVDGWALIVHSVVASFG